MTFHCRCVHGWLWYAACPECARIIYPDHRFDRLSPDGTLDKDLADEAYQLFVPTTWFERRVERKLDKIITLLGGDQ